MPEFYMVFFPKKILSPIWIGTYSILSATQSMTAILKNKPEKNVLLHQLDIATNKPILVYLPTYDEDTSIQLFGNEIGVLRDKFYILTKPHHCTARLPEKSYDLERLYAISDKVLDGNASFTDICSCADFYITDAKSGASLESLYINSKPAVFLTPRNGPALKQFYPELFKIAACHQCQKPSFHIYRKIF